MSSMAAQNVQPQPAPRGPRLLIRSWAILFSLIGAALLVGGIRLVTLGGSAYYLLAGVSLLASAVLLWRLRRSGARLYSLLVMATLLWAVWEGGFYGWAYAPRTLFYLVLGLPLLMPSVRRSLGPGLPPPLRRSPLAWSMLVLLGGIGIGIALHAPYPVKPFPASASQGADGEGDWVRYGRTQAGTRYAPFVQINRSNVDHLGVAWSYSTGVKGTSQATPIQVGSVLYSCSGAGVAHALDIDTGKELWQYAPSFDPKRIGRLENCRGVSYFDSQRAGVCGQRILWATNDAHLYAVDAKTGAPCADFGNGGGIDLHEGLGPVEDQEYTEPSPPVIIRGLAVVGGAVLDGVRVNCPPGVIRAFDAVTGELRWAWDPAREDPITARAPGEVFTPGTPNSWSILSADDQMGLIYVPMGGASPDAVGAARSPSAEKFGSSVVALDANTGRVRWSYQTTHHDLWDYDVPAQPVLVDLKSDSGSTVPAVIIPTKRGEVFVLNRQSGVPVTRVEEWPVPVTDVPGEKTAPTQPFSTGMPAFGRDVLQESQMWGITPIDQMLCRIAFRELRYEGHFTPPSLKGTLEYPGYAGGMNWGSVSVDEDNQVMIVNFMNLANIVRLIPQDKMPEGAGSSPFLFPQRGTPYGAALVPFLSALYTPCQQPPFGEIAAVDLRSREVLWRRPLGSTEELGPLGLRSGLPFTMGVINRAGTLVTRGGLVFMGGTMDRRLRAFDIRTGDTVWTAMLPRVGHATPMSYVSPRTGRQYVVMTVPGHNPPPTGGHGEIEPLTGLVPKDSSESGAIIAYALQPAH
ncbi:membrane-bound PQQ-dependent dehydrogenase, glucose/quinate/shikimate family [Ideonella sp. B508-1]|uniref:membrane-bound PQQ-dependent dehydrogenase, glucose/quinate/shikimate family n=1 Tax=Ideonella sp. B508-1 TaxID=137716 RepID=UPI000344A3B0|nr:membrane-bound PQQ-dependent dehydrogenase, glucose/quinate/shikimate family [Ideonella sp. B508-1]